MKYIIQKFYTYLELGIVIGALAAIAFFIFLLFSETPENSFAIKVLLVGVIAFYFLFAFSRLKKWLNIKSLTLENENSNLIIKFTTLQLKKPIIVRHDVIIPFHDIVEIGLSFGSYFGYCFYVLFCSSSKVENSIIHKPVETYEVKQLLKKYPDLKEIGVWIGLETHKVKEIIETVKQSNDQIKILLPLKTKL